MPRPKKDKELIVKVAGETIKLREGEERTVHLPMTLRLTGGILYFTPPDVYHQEIVVEPAQRLADALEGNRGGMATYGRK